MEININVPEGWQVDDSEEIESFEEIPSLDPEDAKLEQWKQWKDSP